MGKLSPKDVRTLKIGAACAAAILVFAVGTQGYGRWQKVRKSLTQMRAKVADVAVDEAKQKGLQEIVPVFEMPKAEQEQRMLFRDKLNEQFKKAGIKPQPLEVVAPKKSGSDEYATMRIRCKGKCRFEQVLDLLVALKENPYLVGIEEMKIQCDMKQPPEKRQDVDLELTVTTFVSAK